MQTNATDQKVFVGKVYHTQKVGSSVYGRLPREWKDSHFVLEEISGSPNTILLRKVDILMED